MMFSDLPSAAEATSRTKDSAEGFAQAGNRSRPHQARAGFFGIMLMQT
jgi:hypothetical protein